MKNMDFAVLVALLAILITLLLEILRRPKLRIEIAAPQNLDDPPGPAARPKVRWVHLRVINKVPPPLFRKIIHRFVAAQCWVELTFRDPAMGLPLFDPIIARWDRRPQPVFKQIIEDPNSPGQYITVDAFNDHLLPEGERIDITSNPKGETLAPAIKHEGQLECFGFTGLSYAPRFMPGWSNPAWRIGEGEWWLDARAVSGQSETLGRFVLHNHGATREGFYLRERRQNLADRVFALLRSLDP